MKSWNKNFILFPPPYILIWQSPISTPSAIFLFKNNNMWPPRRRLRFRAAAERSRKILLTSAVVSQRRCLLVHNRFHSSLVNILWIYQSTAYIFAFEWGNKWWEFSFPSICCSHEGGNYEEGQISSSRMLCRQTKARRSLCGSISVKCCRIDLEHKAKE